MSDKAPGKPNGKKPGKTLKEKRTAKKLKRNTSGPDRSERRTNVTRDRTRGCWYSDQGTNPGWAGAHRA